jgi:hypothetical protein
MSQAGRMGRAKEMGFDTETVLYHGTASDFDSFDLDALGSATGAKSADYGIYLTDNKRQADGYAWSAAGAIRRSGAIDDEAAKKSRVMQLLVKGKYKVFDVDAETAKIADDIGISKEEYSNMPLSDRQALLGRWSEWVGDLVREAKSQKFDGVEIRGAVDDATLQDFPTNQRIVFDPSNIRSVTAAFDPEKSGSSTLLAAAPFAAVGGAGLTLAGEDARNQRTVGKPKTSQSARTVGKAKTN